MLKSLLRLWLAVSLIAVASAVLLLTDRAHQRGESHGAGNGQGSTGKVRSVALFQYVSQETLEECVRGVIAGLGAAGFEVGRTLQLHRYNAEGDTATANSIARAIVGSDAELIITLTTPSLQAVAAANRDEQRRHVFGMVSDPVAAGVGIARDDPMKHPPYMVGLGTMQPVAETFRLARKLAPRLAKVGAPWNPAEANSEAGMKIARSVCKELGIELLEATVDGSGAVREATASLVGRGVEAIYVGGDNVVLASLDAVIGPARAGHVPAFSSVPGCAARGTLFDLGADYRRVGESVGSLAGRVLGGQSPAYLPILYEVPPELWINHPALARLTGGWSFPPEIETTADVVVEERGPVRRHARKEVAAHRPSRIWKVGLVGFSESKILEELISGFRRGLADAGLVDGQDYSIANHNAQGDIATLSSLFDELSGNDSELVIAISTPALQTALRKVDRKPVVFAGVLDPFAAGAGKTNSDHKPNVTGAYLAYPYAAMIRSVREIVPAARRVGTLFAPGEVNSVLARDRFVEPLKAAGLELKSVPVSGPAEVSDAALALCQSGVDVVCQISDNLSNSSFAAIARACEMAKTPLFTFSPSHVARGAVIGVGCDFEENGHDAGLLVADLVRGADVAKVPFRATAKISRTVNLDTARRLGINVPAEWVKLADKVIPGRP
jgi:ABC-type uncharacterized transport system substrate-binding protein